MNPSAHVTSRPLILLVDDEANNLQVLRHILQDDYRLMFAKDGHKALQLVQTEKPDLILLDVMMPDMDGYEVCRRLKANTGTQHIPVIFVTALADVNDEKTGFELGAVDYITKPVSPPIVRARVKNHLSLVRVEELLETRLQIVQTLGLAAEYKDNETGLHVIRMSRYTQLLARAAGFSEADAERILHAAPMHDVGKIGIPDAILRKPGKLDADEWQVMQTHAAIGGRIIGQHDSGLLKMAHDIAVSHHEKWDGSGYPGGLAGTDIPIEARMVAIADVFDALTSERPYKKAWPVEQAVQLLRDEAGKHFDPELVLLFIEQLPEILKIKEQWAEERA